MARACKTTQGCQFIIRIGVTDRVPSPIGSIQALQCLLGKVILLSQCEVMLTSPSHKGLMVLDMMEERLSWPWWVNFGRPLLFPGWIDIFRQGSGLKNIPFFRFTARKSELEYFMSIFIFILQHISTDSFISPDRVKLTSFRQCSYSDCSSTWPSPLT